jgi:hypothetical protein
VQGQSKSLAAQGTTESKVVNSAALYSTLNVPWSKPVTVTDPFEGTFTAVFDRNDIDEKYLSYGDRGKTISLWSRNSIRVLLSITQRNCNISYSASRLRSHPAPWYSDCSSANSPRTVKQLLIKVGSQVLPLTGENSKFEVSDAVAAALKTAPEQDISIRLVLEGGETIDSEIGKKTVAVWRRIY